VISPGLGWLLVMLGGAVLVAFALGWAGHRPPRPNLYQCLRCRQSFRESPDRPFPARCPACGSPDWNVS
jgi:hypothetical protein